MSYGDRETAKGASSGAVKFTGRITDWMWVRAAEWNGLQRLLFSSDGAPSQRVVVGAAILLTLPIAHYFWKYEGFWEDESDPANLFFVSSVTLTLAAGMVLAFRRVLVASVLVNALVGIAAAVAAAKQQAMGMALHAYDVVFYLSSWSTIGFLWRDYQTDVIALMAGLVATAIAAGVAYRFDTTRVRRRSAFVAVVILTLVSIVAVTVKGGRNLAKFYWSPLYISSFYSSWAETVETLWRGQLIEAANSAPGARFACRRNAPPRQSLRTSFSSIRSWWCRPATCRTFNTIADSTGCSFPMMARSIPCGWKHTVGDRG